MFARQLPLDEFGAQLAAEGYSVRDPSAIAARGAQFTMPAAHAHNSTPRRNTRRITKTGWYGAPSHASRTISAPHPTPPRREEYAQCTHESEIVRPVRRTCSHDRETRERRDKFRKSPPFGVGSRFRTAAGSSIVRRIARCFGALNAAWYGGGIDGDRHRQTRSCRRRRCRGRTHRRRHSSVPSRLNNRRRTARASTAIHSAGSGALGYVLRGDDESCLLESVGARPGVCSIAAGVVS